MHPHVTLIDRYGHPKHLSNAQDGGACCCGQRRWEATTTRGPEPPPETNDRAQKREQDRGGGARAGACGRGGRLRVRSAGGGAGGGFGPGPSGGSRCVLWGSGSVGRRRRPVDPIHWAWAARAAAWLPNNPIHPPIHPPIPPQPKQSPHMAPPDPNPPSSPSQPLPPRFRRIPREELERLNHAGNGVVAGPGGGHSAQSLPPPFAQQLPPAAPTAAGQGVGGDGGGSVGPSVAFDALGRRADARWEAALGPGAWGRRCVLCIHVCKQNSNRSIGLHVFTSSIHSQR